MTWPEPLNPEVRQGLDELAVLFGELSVVPEGQGGARVTIKSLPLPGGLNRSESWCGFVIPYNYDDAQVYGHHFPADLRRADGQQLDGPGFNYSGNWDGAPALIVSRSSPGWRKGTDTAALKLVKVIEFLKRRAA
jgi:hypothetical protein